MKTGLIPVKFRKIIFVLTAVSLYLPASSAGDYKPQKYKNTEQTITDIAESDTDVQNLISEGYIVTSVRPVIKTTIDAEGNVVTKATNAVLILQKDTTGHASVMIDIEEAKVTQIVILTKTVIEKP